MNGSRALAVVLAAGRGERLGGRAKASLTLADGRSFVAAVAQAARAAGVARVVVVAAAPWEAETRAAAAAAGVDEVITNLAPERGMASSFACGLGEAGAAAEVALCWPVDHPGVQAATVVTLLEAAAADRIVVPMYAGRGGHPSVFGAAHFAACAAAAGAEGGLRGVLRDQVVHVRRLVVDDAGVRRDVDTLDDWARLRDNGRNGLV